MYITSFLCEVWFLGVYLVLHLWHVYIRSFLQNYGFLVSTWSFMYDMCTSDLSFWTMVSWSTGPSYIWHVYIRSFLLNYGFLVSTWSFMYDMCTSDLSFWTMVSWSLPGPSCMTCVHQIFPSELWFLGLYLVLHVYDMCTSDLSFWTMVSWSLPGPSCMTCVHQIFPSELWFLGVPSSSCMTCVHQIIPYELWFLGLYLVLHVWHVYIRSFLLNYGFLFYLDLQVWHVYIRSFLLNYGFLVSTWSFMNDMCTSDLSFWTMVSWSLLVLHVWHVYIRSFLLNYGFLVSTWSFMYDMCTSDLSFWTMVSWSLPGPSCMTCVHQIFPSELWFLGLYLVLHVWHVYIRSFLLNYGFLVSTWSFMYMTCVHQIFPSELWFLGLYLVLHVWHVYIRSFLLNYGFLSLPGPSCMTCVHQIFPSELLGPSLKCVHQIFPSECMVSWSLLVPSCMTCVHQIFPSELWFLGLYLVLHVWHVYIRSFLLNYGFLVSTWSFMYDMCTSDLSFWTMVSWSTCFFMYDMCTSDLSFWTMVSWSLPGPSCMTCVHQIFPSELWFLGLPGPSCMNMCTSDLSFWTMVSWSLPGPSCMTYVHQIFPSELWFLGLYLVLHVWHVYIRSFLLNYGFLVYLVLHVWHVYIRSFLLNYGFLVSTWSFMYDMCTSDLSFWTMVSWSLRCPLCMTCVHQIFPSELWFLGLYLNYGLFMYDMCTSDLFFWTIELWFLGLPMDSWFLPGPSCMTFLHVWHVYIRSFLLNYGFLVSTWSFMYDMCTSDLSFWTMVSWSLPGPSCMTCVHQIFPSELQIFPSGHLVLVYIRSFLLNYGLPGMTCVHQIFPSELWNLGLPSPSWMTSWCVWHVYIISVYIRSFLLNWTMVSWCVLPGFLGLYLLHVWHVYIRSFLLNYGFLVSTWSFMYDMCRSDLSFWTMVSWSLPGSSCMTCVHQIFPSELWFLGLSLVLHVWHVYIRSFLLNYGFLVSTCCPSCMICVHQIFPS